MPAKRRRPLRTSFTTSMLAFLAAALLNSACISSQPKKTYTFSNSSNTAALSLDALTEQEFEVATINIAGTRRGNLNVAKVLYALFTGADYLDEAVIDAYAQFIDEQSIDVVGLQEAELESQYMRKVNQAAAILNKTGLSHGLGSAHYNVTFLCSSVFNHGNAIISRYALSEPEIETILDKVSIFSLNAALYKTLNLLGGHKTILRTSMIYDGSKGPENLSIINFHASTLGDGLREEEMRILARYVAANAPAIVMGDMNTKPKTEDGKEMHPRWKIYFDELKRLGIEISVDPRYNFFTAEPTSPELFSSNPDDPNKAIDFIMAANKKGAIYRYDVKKTYVVEVKTPDRRPASDHMAVVGVVRVR